MAEQDTWNDGDPGLFEDPPTGESLTPDSAIGRIALKQVRVSRAEAESRTRDGEPKRASQPPTAERATQTPAPTSSPLNRLVPYLDLFCRLTDEELSRLARTPISAVETLRQQVDEVNRVLGRYLDLLPRLNDEELIRLTGATPKTIRFWRLCQPRGSVDTRSRGDVPQATPRETSAVRSVVQAFEEGSSDSMQLRQVAGDSMAAMPHPAESGTMIVDEQLSRSRRE